MQASATDRLEAEGVVLEQHRGDLYLVDATLGSSRRRVLCRRAGRLVLRRILVLEGDRVRVELSPYDPNRGRITYRFRETGQERAR